MACGLHIDEQTFTSMKADDQRRALFQEMRKVTKIKKQVEIQWYWLSALTLGLASFFTWIVNSIINR